MPSTHEALVFRIDAVHPHPNADSLEIVKFYEYPCVVQKGMWKSGDLAVFVPDDTIVDIRRPEFSFLSGKAKADGTVRIKPIRLRGEWSQGLVIAPPEGAKEGDDTFAHFGLTHYDPEEPAVRANKVKGNNPLSGSEEDPEAPNILTGPTKYDIENLQRYPNLFEEGEPVIVTEKVDGSNVRYVYHDGRYWVRSRNRWVKRKADYSHITRDFLLDKGVPPEDVDVKLEYVQRKLANPGINSFWKALEKHEALLKFLRDNPGVTVFGEVYGTNGKIHYEQGPESFVLFDVFDKDRWRDRSQWPEELEHLWVPQLHYGHVRYNYTEIRALASGPSILSPKARFREGIVVTPVENRRVDFGRGKNRLILKTHSPEWSSL